MPGRTSDPLTNRISPILFGRGEWANENISIILRDRSLYRPSGCASPSLPSYKTGSVKIKTAYGSLC